MLHGYIHLPEFIKMYTSDLSIWICVNFVVVQLPSHVRFFATPWTEHTRFPCPSLSPGVCSDSCSLSGWCHPTISSSVALFSFYMQSFAASRSFPVSWLFTSDGQSIGAFTMSLKVNSIFFCKKCFLVFSLANYKSYFEILVWIIQIKIRSLCMGLITYLLDGSHYALSLNLAA